MGYPVVHFEVTGTDSEKLHEYYAEMFGWPIDADNEMGYGIIDKDRTAARASAAASPRARRATPAT